MEYWQLIDFIKNKVCKISSIDELDRHLHFTMKILCEDREFHIGVNYENVELTCREVNER